MIHDFRFAFRQLIKAPGFTFAAVLVLALGIGANTAVFSLVNTLFFAPPAYAKPHEMVQIFSQDKKDPKKFRGFSYPTYRDIREQNTVFSDAMAFNLALIGLGQKGDTRRTFAAVVTSNYFSVLGAPLVRGRAFLPEEETPGRNAPVAIASYSYWQKHNLDPAVLGSQVLINGRPFTIVGITPKGFAGTLQILSPEVWLPISVYDQVANDFGSKDKTTIEDRNGRQLRIIGRLKPGITATAAKPALAGLAVNLEKADPVEQKNQTFITAPVSRIAVSTNPTAARGVKSIAPLLLGMAVVVLLVACLNLANMLLARGTARRKEIAIRLALGGSRWRIVRQLLSEGFVLALLGGVGGLILGVWSSSLLIGSMRKFMPFEIVWSTGANPAILAATFGFCLLGTLMFALGPALKISRSAVITDLKEHAGEDTMRRRGKFLPRNPLVVVQLAFSLALLTAAALFVRGANKAASVDSGLKPGASYLLEVDASLAGYAVCAWIPKQRFLFCSVPFARPRNRSRHRRLAPSCGARCRSLTPNHFVANICPVSRFEPGPLACARRRGHVLRLWGTGARSGCRWSLWSQSVFGRAAHLGDRDSYGAGRTARDGVAIDYARGVRHAFEWASSWSSACGRDRKNT
jgi:predicted permease